MSNKFYSSEFKYEVVMAYKRAEDTVDKLCSRYQITLNSLYDWMRRFEKKGINGLEDVKVCKSYTKELKEAAVKAYLSGGYSQREVIRKYEISSTSVLQKWIKQYNGHREFKDSGKGTVKSMTKGRKTTWEERIQIAIDCLEKGKDYQETAGIYDVSYQQVYQWVGKYEAGGAEALKDKRGRIKEEAELSSEEKTKLEMKKLERENERLKAEIAFLKKLEELERRRY